MLESVVLLVAVVIGGGGLALSVGGIESRSRGVGGGGGGRFRLTTIHLFLELDVVALGKDFDVIRGSVPRAPREDQRLKGDRKCARANVTEQTVGHVKDRYRSTQRHTH